MSDDKMLNIRERLTMMKILFKGCHELLMMMCVLCVLQSKKLQPGKIGVFSQSHYYLALYRFKAIEKDDLDVQ